MSQLREANNQRKRKPLTARAGQSERTLKGEKPTELAKRVMDDRYGEGNYDPCGQEFSQLKNWGTKGQ